MSLLGSQPAVRLGFGTVPLAMSRSARSPRGLLEKVASSSIDDLWSPWAAAAGEACYRFDLSDAKGIHADSEVDDLARPKKRKK